MEQKCVEDFVVRRKEHVSAAVLSLLWVAEITPNCIGSPYTIISRTYFNF